MSNINNQHDHSDVGEIRFRDISPALEFICWIVLGLAPLLRWVNGPAVSTDQFTVQVLIVSTAAAGALGLRIYHWRSRRAH